MDQGGPDHFAADPSDRDPPVSVINERAGGRGNQRGGQVATQRPELRLRVPRTRLRVLVGS